MMLLLAFGAVSAGPIARALPPQLLPVYGGAGGTAFTRSCGAGKVLTGLRFRDGLLVDAIGILCRPVLSGGALGSESTVGTLVGGTGGTSGSTSCPSGRVLIGAYIAHGSFVNSIRISCQDWIPTTRSFGGQINVYDPPIGSYSSGGTTNKENCEAPTQPANGIRGRAQSLVDAFGLVCDEP